MCGIIVEERPVLPVVWKPLESPVRKMKPSRTLAKITTINRTATMTGETPLVLEDLLNAARDLMMLPRLIIARVSWWR